MSYYEVQIFFDAAWRIVGGSAAQSAACCKGADRHESSHLQRWRYQWGQALCRLIRGSDGNFYGTTRFGGPQTVGTVFRISPSGAYTNIYSFASTSTFDGWQPLGRLVLGSDGNFYGTTITGGSNGFGTVFRISPGGSYTVLHRFTGGFYYGNDDGQSPYGALVEGSDGNFYGTAAFGGTNTCACGVVYRISPGGSYTTLYSFRDSPDGSNPHAGLVLGSDGNFYGTTALNGTSFRGTVFKLVVSLSSPANQMNGITVAGTNVVITVASVAGETYQLQYATDLTSGNWSNVPGVSVTNSIGGPLTVTNLGGALSPGRYYRLAITP